MKEGGRERAFASLVNPAREIHNRDCGIPLSSSSESIMRKDLTCG